MSDILCVTNRKLCKEDFFLRIEKIAGKSPGGIILREKDLSQKEYRELALRVKEICQRHNTLCILHTFTEVATEIGCKALHLPLPVLRTICKEDRERFTVLGASCHSVEEAIEAQKLGCTYIIAGHIFVTDCKKGVEGRELTFLKEVCEAVSIPVYGIGGIHLQNICEVRNAGAAGACMMSSIMSCDNPMEYLDRLKERGNG